MYPCVKVRLTTITLVQLKEELLKYGGVVTSDVATFYPVSRKQTKHLKKLQFEVLNRSIIKLFPSEKKYDMILTPRFETIVFNFRVFLFYFIFFFWIRQRLKQNFFSLGDFLANTLHMCVCVVFNTNRQNFNPYPANVENMVSS